MSTAAISGSSIFQEIQTFYQTRQADLKQLGGDLQSGNLSGAQSDYKSLAALGEDGPFANSEPFSNSSRAEAFNSVGEALQAGDLSQAQAAFATLTGSQSNLRANPATVVNLTSTQTGGATSSTPTSSSAASPSDASSIYDQLRAYQQQRKADVTQLGQDLQAGNLTAAQQDFNTLTALGQSGPNANGQAFQRTDRAQDFQAIGQALQSGDLAGAQTAFASLAGTFGQGGKLPPSTITLPPVAGGPAPVVPPIVQAPHPEPPVSVGPPTGNLPPSTVILPPVDGGPVPVRPPVAQGPTNLPPSTITLPPSTGTVSTGSGAPGIVINLNGASGAGASRGSGTSEIVVNLGQASGSSSASPEEITLNLDRSSSGEQLSIDTTQGQNGSSAEQFTINLNPQNNYEVILNLLNSSSTSSAQSSSNNALSVQA